MRELRPGENVTVAGSLTLSAQPPGPAVMVSLGADDRVAGQPDGSATGHSGVHEVDVARLRVDLPAVGADVYRVLLVAHGGAPAPVATYTVSTDTDQFQVSTRRSATLAARVVLELYRRAGAWRLRALDEGYAGGLAQLGAEHGVELPGGALVPTASSADAASAAPADGPASAEDRIWESERLLRRLSGVWEDAARSAAAYDDAVSFAESRRDREIEQLLADPAARRADHPERLAAERRCREVIDIAANRRFGDIDELSAELGEIDQTLPASAAAWTHPVWQRPLPELGSGLVRLGEISADGSPGLAIPLLRYVAGQGAVLLAAESFTPAVHAMLLRVLAAKDRGCSLSIATFDPALGSAFSTMPLSGVPQRSEQLSRIALGVDLLDMERSARGTAGASATVGGGADDVPGVLVVDGTAVAPDQTELAAIHRIADLGADFGLTIVLLAPIESLGEWAGPLQPLLLPTVPIDISDGWLGRTWNLTPAHGVPTSQVTEQVLRRAAG